MLKILLNLRSILIFLAVIFIYLYLNYYVGAKGYKVLRNFYPSTNLFLYYGVFWLIALSYVISMAFRDYLPSFIRSFFTTTGVYWMGAFVYLLLFFPVMDLIRFIFKRLHVFSPGIEKIFASVYANGLIVFVLVLLLIFYGVYNAAHPTLTKYSVLIPKKAGTLSELNIAMVSDIHLGSGVKDKNLDKMVQDINSLKPDIVFFCGDIIDENTPLSSKEYLPTALKKIQSKYGSYVIAGNHEHFTKDLEQIESYFKAGNIVYLRDKGVKIADSFYVIGREDLSMNRSGGSKRLALSDITEGMDQNLPLIVLDHQPSALKEAEDNKVDLQLSGHTHQGQLFPGNLITKRVFEDDYGYLKKSQFQLIVSSGYGTWGPPIRIGTKGEIVSIHVQFSK